MRPHPLAPLPLLTACATAPTAAPADPWSATVGAAIAAESRSFYADGDGFRASLLTTDHGLRLWVDDAGARYPLRVDPAYTTADTTLTGVAVGDEFGTVLASAGDVNGDGYEDIIIGAPQYDSQRGAAYVFHGSSAGVDTTAETTMWGVEVGDLFGRSVAGAGDVNGDGYDDVIIGAPHVGEYQGQVDILYGSSAGVDTLADQTLGGASMVANGFFGGVVDGAGDVNGDGYDDVLVSAYGVGAETGQVTVYHGSASGVVDPPNAVFAGTQARSFFGLDARGAGDVNGDGYDDIIIGAPGASTVPSYAHLYVGAAAGLISTPALMIYDSYTDAGVGTYVDGAGDLNGDGYDDIVVFVATATTGTIQVFHGGGALDATADATLVIDDGSFSVHARGAGDVNGDGTDDLLLSDFEHDGDDGAVWLHLGSATGVSSTPYTTFKPEAEGVGLGRAIAGAGDVNGDGYDDVLIGAYLADNGAGQALLYLGPTEPTVGDTGPTDDSGDPGDPGDTGAPSGGKKDGGRCATGPRGSALGLALALIALGRRRR